MYLVVPGKFIAVNLPVSALTLVNPELAHYGPAQP
jgi:hypothetical protein